jgi:hypothetical protein
MMSSHPVTKTRAWIWLSAVLAGTALAVAAGRACAQTPGEMRDYQKKAEFIASFTRFVDWPERKFAIPDAPFVIGVYGADSISTLIQEVFQERQVKGRPVVVKHLLNKQELRGCHVLFVSRSERDRLGPILGEVRRENVLTVGESENFLGKGGVINFVSIGGTVRFQINPDAAAREKLTISSKLRQLAIPDSTGLSTVPAGGLRLSDMARPALAR